MFCLSEMREASGFNKVNIFITSLIQYGFNTGLIEESDSFVRLDVIQ